MSASRPREEARRHLERPHVLIVTDDPSLATFLGEGLLMGGFWTSVVSHGLQVLEVFRLRQFDLIVLDFELGNFEAMELLLRLRGASPRAAEQDARTAAPIVVMSSQQVGLDPAEQMKLGVGATLQAPVDLEDVVRTLHQVFETWRLDHPNTPLADALPGS